MDPAIKSKLVFMGLLTTLVIFGVGVAAGAMLRPLAIIPLLAVVLTILHVQTQFSKWRERFKSSAVTGAVRLVGTYLAQCVFAGVTYLVGHGGARLFGRSGDLNAFGPIDIYLTAGLLVVGGAVAIIVMRLTKQITGDLQSILSDLQTDIEDLQADLGDITDDTSP